MVLGIPVRLSADSLAVDHRSGYDWAGSCNNHECLDITSGESQPVGSVRKLFHQLHGARDGSTDLLVACRHVSLTWISHSLTKRRSE